MNNVQNHQYRTQHQDENNDEHHRLTSNEFLEPVAANNLSSSLSNIPIFEPQFQRPDIAYNNISKKTSPSKPLIKASKKSKVRIKDILKLKKALKSNDTKQVKGPDNLAMLSLIASLTGIIFLLLPGIGILALLLGLAGLGGGILSLRNGTSRRGLAIGAIVIGGIISLSGLLTVLLIGAFLA